MYIKRSIESEIRLSLENVPVTAIIGPRQCGKSTLARHITGEMDNSVFLDLEKPSDLAKLDNPEWYLSSQKNNLVILDEIQRKPDLFPLIRSLADEWQQNGKFLILGSASPDLLKQSSESLAGRISYRKLTPLLWNEISMDYNLETYMLRGGFPRSLLNKNDKISAAWIDDFITTFIERDLLFWAGIAPSAMRRLWQMLAHNNGQTVNYSSLGNSLGVSNTTVKNYVDLLEGTYMLEIVPPYYKNFGKRILKAPKVYITDNGLTTRLLQLSGFDQISGHPVFGSLWEALVLVNLKGNFRETNCYFFRTSNGAEIDFVTEINNKQIAIECKATLSPTLTRGNYSAIENIKPDHVFVVAPVNRGWPMAKGVEVVSVNELIERLRVL
ncbi:MAG: ATP-binding protein [Bacteroidales bacterium]|nr:ATP-binding protein [Bacteroidales bacterium]